MFIVFQLTHMHFWGRHISLDSATADAKRQKPTQKYKKLGIGLFFREIS